MAYAWIIVALSALAQGLAFRESLAGTSELWWVLGLASLLLGGLGLRRLWQAGRLVERMRPRAGDVTMGAIAGVLLLVGSWAGRSALAPTGSVQHAWLLRIYLLFGDPNVIQRSASISLSLLVIVTMTEIAWRGCVLDALVERFGDRRAFLYAVLLYGAAALPTVITLRDPLAGPNPLFPLLSIGTGIFFTFLARVTGRLPPSIIAHLVFAYFSAVQFRLPGILP